jgi:exosortase
VLRWVLVLGVVGFFCLPWLVAQSLVLWGVPHYQFFPILPLAAAALAVRGVRGLGPLVPGMTWVTAGLLGVSWLLSLAAAVIYSPTLGTVAALVALAALAHGLGGFRLLGALLPAAFLLALMVRPPLRLDFELIYRLQTLATNWSSQMLDLLGVLHVRSGHVLEIPARRLFVEEACSGATSLYVVLAVALVALLWARRGWVTSLLVLAAAAAWALIGNMARIIAGTAALALWQVDLTAGWPHEVLGVVALVVVLALIASTDRLIARTAERLGALRQAWREWSAARRQQRQAERLMAEPTLALMQIADMVSATPAASAASSPPDASRPPREPTRWPDPRTTWVGSPPVLLVFAALALVGVAATRAGITLSASGLEERLATLTAETLPQNLGPFRRQDFEASRSEAAGILGSRSRIWRYEPEGAPGASAPAMTVDVSNPYIGWHELTDCYKSQGWMITSRWYTSVNGADAVVVRMERPLEGAALLVFASDDARGDPLRAPEGAGWHAVLGERLSQGWWRLWGAPQGPGRGRSSGPVPSYQVQLLFLSPMPISDEGQRQALDLFGQVRTAVRRHVRPTGA